MKFFRALPGYNPRHHDYCLELKWELNLEEIPTPGKTGCWKTKHKMEISRTL
ncbi:hypothetical protein B7P43_G05844 [Cryptotermes secundus]|uniref:Uncharacterized protein n=1 Tax=Cryptotermes secundus TaxID=105785 RepID=A0A2J7QN89_9NEOP|nr:hypothetical protein B7P43_G05844 [Cryptotermes secundus]